MANKRLRKLLIVVNVIVAVCFFGGPMTSIAQDSDSMALEKLLSQSGYSYVKNSDTVWHIDYNGKSLPKYMLVITKNDEVVVIFVTVARKDNMILTSEAMQKLLQANFNYDKVKIGLDHDGDLSIRIDQSIRSTDIQELKDNINQVALAADELYAIISPYLSNK